MFMEEGSNNMRLKMPKCKHCEKRDDCINEIMMCEKENCQGTYIGKYWEPNEYSVPGDGSAPENLVMECCICGDEIEI